MERYREDQIALLNLYDMLFIDSGLVDNGSDLIAVADDCKSTWLVVSIFGPKAPKGMEDSWLQTIPGKSWFTILRMYGPLKPWIDKTWRPGEIELVK